MKLCNFAVFTLYCSLLPYSVGKGLRQGPHRNLGGVLKVDVCHRNNDGTYNLITVGEPAYESHVAHGDASPGEPVPGSNQQMMLDGDCNVIDNYCLFDTVIVDARNYSPTSSNVALKDGKDYKIVASGTYSPVGCYRADAKYSNPCSGCTCDPENWLDKHDESYSFAYLELCMLYSSFRDGNSCPPPVPCCRDDVNQVNWGTFNPAHKYEYTITGDGSRLQFYIADCCYNDNYGSLDIKIYNTDCP